MSEEQLKKLNERLAKAEELLDRANPLLIALHELFGNTRSKELEYWLNNYQTYLQTYKK